MVEGVECLPLGLVAPDSNPGHNGCLCSPLYLSRCCEFRTHTMRVKGDENMKIMGKDKTTISTKETVWMSYIPQRGEQVPYIIYREACITIQSSTTLILEFLYAGNYENTLDPVISLHPTSKTQVWPISYHEVLTP